LIVVIVLVVALFDWNWLRDPIARKVTRATGRSFAINGDLNVHLSLHPRVIADNIVLGNAEWASEPNMAEIKRLDFRFDLLKLLGGKLAFPEMALSEPRIALEVSKDNVPNWVFDGDKTKADQPLEFPDIGSLTIDRGSAIYRDPRINTDFKLDVRTLEDSKTNPDMNLEVAGKGRFKGLATTLHARGGALLSLRDVAHPYPVKASGTLGATKASIDGMLLDPLHLKGEQLNFHARRRRSCAALPADRRAYPADARVQAGGISRPYRRRMDVSAVQGQGRAERSRRRLFRRSRQDSADDHGEAGVATAAHAGPRRVHRRRSRRPAEQDTAPRATRCCRPEPFSLEKLNAANADVNFRGEKIITDKMPLEKMTAHLTLQNGVLRLSPLDFSVAAATWCRRSKWTPARQPIAVRADITAKGLDLALMFPESKLAETSAGMMGGHAKLAGNGNSLRQMLGTANGEAALIMDGGTVSELLLRLSNLDIANSVIVFLGGDKKVPIRCMVSNFKAVNGDFQVESLLLETPKVDVTGSGDINLADETLRLRLVSESESFSLASLRGPIVITGSLKKPAVRPEMGNVVARGGLAVVLGVITAGLGALLPLLEFGKRKQPSACALLMNQAKADAGVKASDLTPRNNRKK
jgi:uncharacterized protein involved in outer membrane biogenesis